MIGVLVSGTGTNLQALLDAGLPVVAVASNKRDAAALERATCATRAFELADFPDREARDAGGAADLGCAFDELRHVLELDLGGGDVVEQHERLGAARDHVVDAVRREVGAAGA